MAAKGRRILYQETADAIRARIASGELAPGELVGPSLASLAAGHHVGIATMRAALGVLSDEGLVETIPGKGTFVLGGARAAAAREQQGNAALEQRVEALEVDMIELYSKLGWPRPGQRGGGRKARREQAS